MKTNSAWTLLFALGCTQFAREHTNDPLSRDEKAVTVCAPNGTVAGVDVSDFQPNTDWASVKGANRLFALIKATEGVTYTSPTFATDWQGAQANGVFRSAYHFFRPQDDGVAQAQQFLSVVGTNLTGDLPAMLDVEVTDGQATATIVQRMSDWLSTVQAQTGKAPFIYTSPSFWDSTLGGPSGFSQYPLFIANWGVSCPNVPGEWTNWTLWQSTDSESVPGIQGPVDADAFNGSAAELAALAGGTVATCGPSTCAGCCNGNTCVALTSEGASACGTGGAACVACGSGASCSNGSCQTTCVPNCGSAVCGPDGCGGSCGSCAAGQACNPTGQCQATGGGCAHPICQSGVSLDGTCDPCASQVCGQDPYCCSVFWDRICVGEVGSICGQSC